MLRFHSIPFDFQRVSSKLPRYWLSRMLNRSQPQTCQTTRMLSLELIFLYQQEHIMHKLTNTQAPICSPRYLFTACFGTGGTWQITVVATKWPMASNVVGIIATSSPNTPSAAKIGGPNRKGYCIWALQFWKEIYFLSKITSTRTYRLRLIKYIVTNHGTESIWLEIVGVVSELSPPKIAK